jgi:hypothetical protein
VKGAQPDTALPRVLQIEPAAARMGDRITIATARAPRLKAGERLVLFLDGRTMDSVFANPVGPTGNLWEVRLRRNGSTRAAWEPVLGQPVRNRQVRVGLGLPAGPEFAAADDAGRTLTLRIVSIPWLIVFVVLWSALISWMWRLAKNHELLHDAPPRPVSTDPAASGAPDATPHTARAGQPYSLARSQAAFWFVLVTTAFVAIWLITGDYHGVMTEQALLLMGIASLTALGAGAVETVKNKKITEGQTRQALMDEQKNLERRSLEWSVKGLDQAGGERRDLAAMALNAQKIAAMDPTPPPASPPHRRFWFDILQSDGAISLHRLQVVVWTVLLGAVFVREVWTSLALPDFDNNLLALLVVSGGLYVFSKNNESHT